MKMLLIVPALAAALAVGGCAQRMAMGYGPGYQASPPHGRVVYAAEGYMSHEGDERGERDGCREGEKDITLPSGRRSCVEHITDKKFLHQPEFNRAGEKDERCAGHSPGDVIKIRLGHGLVGNYHC